MSALTRERIGLTDSNTRTKITRKIQTLHNSKEKKEEETHLYVVKNKYIYIINKSYHNILLFNSTFQYVYLECCHTFSAHSHFTTK